MCEKAPSLYLSPGAGITLTPALSRAGEGVGLRAGYSSLMRKQPHHCHSERSGAESKNLKCLS